MHDPSIIDIIVISSACGYMAELHLLVQCNGRRVPSVDLQDRKTGSASTAKQTSKSRSDGSLFPYAMYGALLYAGKPTIPVSEQLGQQSPADALPLVLRMNRETQQLQLVR